ncbi:MAG: geranylgeranylglyceryl/heptaprenylglyceryl phosphate synthase [Nitrososphaerota archaeon]|nr:geranylgeranylglyceryl/heptaprenylglyceryl phosphate synthase [Nitrososphaerales archaeon]MDW8045188.1 geranylgeranylglyceryl/heptaprenylglyceryl phosphate synthase [Nitrososphaerota archaeon]
MNIGPVEERLRREISEYGTICLALLDFEDLPPKKAGTIANSAEKCGVSGILIGGSTAADQLELNSVIEAVKMSVKLPVILFPGNPLTVSPKADAILFSSLLNSDNPYFISQAQALGALLVKKYGLEAIPMGYVVIGDGGAIGFIGRARGIPPSKPNLAAMYALAAQYMGMRFVYLEAGSGVTSHISPSVVSAVRKVFNGVIIAGGGIKRVEDAVEVAKAGADIIVLGTLLEEEGFESTLKEIVKSIRKCK